MKSQDFLSLVGVGIFLLLLFLLVVWTSRKIGGGHSLLGLYWKRNPARFLPEYVDLWKGQFPPQEVVFPKMAVIVEPRNHLRLLHVLQTMMKQEVPILWFHGTQSKVNSDGILEAIRQKKLFLKNLYVENLTREQYNGLLLNTGFWETIPAEKILLFQTDSILCSGSDFSWEDFDSWDYVGGCASWVDLFEGRGGNGGISLRSRKAMIEACRRCAAYRDLPEDVFFSFCLTKHALGAVADRKTQQKFGVDGKNGGWNYTRKPWTLHKPHAIPKDSADRRALLRFCPEAVPFLDS